jgi:hypothetical protein
MILLIVAHVGQINTSSTPRGISMANVDMSLYSAGLASAFKDPIQGLYTSNPSAPLGSQAGLRQQYKFGLYSYCAYVTSTQGICTNHTIADQFRPYDAVISDMITNYSQYTDAIVPDLTFRNSSYLGSSSQAAYWMLLLGTICASLALFTGLVKHTVAFLVSTTLAVLGSLLLLIGAAIWTVAIKKAESINSLVVTQTTVPLGIFVSLGPGLYLIWAAFVCLLISTVPYMISCCTYRG